jgi:single-stranded DNA-binding protein
MAIHTQASISGFIANDPQLSYTERGEARLWVKIGQEHYRKNSDGSFTQTDTTFHDLVAFRKTAERAHARLARGDSFIAEGYIREYDATNPEGQRYQAEEFVAKKIGHDLARTNYDVRRRSDPAPGIEQDSVARQTPAHSAPVLGL